MKDKFYHDLALQLTALIEDEKDRIAALSNASACLNEALENINWVGFYLYKESELVLGPFQGKVACTRIPLGKGVCGTAAISGHIQRVADVHQFPGHIACDCASNSEIVIPLIKDQLLKGVLDIDSTVFNRFDEEDEKGLKEIAAIISKHCF